MQNTKLSILLAALLMISVGSCDNDDPKPVNEEEVITTMTITFSNTQNASDLVVATFRDLDDPGGDAATKTDSNLSADATYTVSISFLNETETRSEDITKEVDEEDEEHQIFYLASSSLDFGYVYDGNDSNGGLIGLEGLAIAGAASTGFLKVTLIHETDKNTVASVSGNPAGVGGEIDIPTDF